MRAARERGICEVNKQLIANAVETLVTLYEAVIVTLVGKEFGVASAGILGVMA